MGADGVAMPTAAVDALLQAAFGGDADRVAALLQCGVHASSRGPGGHIALPLACGEGRAECAALLIAAHADVGACGVDGASPLFTAARAGHAACVLLLLTHGALVDDGIPACSDADDAHSPLQVACAMGHDKCVELLLNHGAASNRSDAHGVTALHSAAWHGHSVIVQHLLRARCDVGTSDASGATALHLAARFGHCATCAQLVSGAAPLCAVDALGACPLHLAIEKGHRDVACVLLLAMAEAMNTAGSEEGGDKRAGGAEVRAIVGSLDGIARAELLAACGLDGAAHASPLVRLRVAPLSVASLRCTLVLDWSDVRPVSHLDSQACSTALATLGLGAITPRDSARHAVELTELPAAFAEQAVAMPLYLRRLLVENAPPYAACIGALLRSLRLPPTEFGAVCESLTRPTRELLMRVPGCLPPHACAALRAAVDAPGAASAKQDSVDGLAEHQLDCTLERLLSLVGAEVVETLRALPARFARGCADDGDGEGRDHEGFDGLQIQRVFVRRYTARERPWFALHMDTAALTANVALSADALHEGGRLLTLVGSEGLVAIERGEGEATVHPSALLHGVSRMRGQAVRYSLICFYRGLEDNVS